jgi:hypothetical protein
LLVAVQDFADGIGEQFTLCLLGLEVHGLLVGAHCSDGLLQFFGIVGTGLAPATSAS